MREIAASNRIRKLRWIALAAIGILFTKVLAEILYEYRFYFPTNFDSSFLIGRQSTFVGAYRVAFYAHIVSGPSAVLFGCLLILSGGRPRMRWVHRVFGRAQMAIVIGVIMPSGLVMVTQAYTGSIAAYGFVVHSLLTGACAVAAVWTVMQKRFQAHQVWATRCFVLLCGPLLLRVISGATIVMNIDNDWTYRITVWVSWLIPLAMYECWRGRSRRSHLAPLKTRQHSAAAKVPS